MPYTKQEMEPPMPSMSMFMTHNIFDDNHMGFNSPFMNLMGDNMMSNPMINFSKNMEIM